MNILFVTEEYPPKVGGVSHSSARIVKRLTKGKVNVTVLTFDTLESADPTPYVKHSIDSETQVEVVRIGPFLRDADMDNVLGQRRIFCETAQALCLEKKIDLIHGFYASGAGYFAAIIARMTRLPLIISVRGNDVGRDTYDFKRFYPIKWTLEQARIITCVSSKLMDMVDRIYGMGSKTMVVPNGIDLDSIISSQVHGKKHKKFVIGFIGIVKEKKGLQILFETVAQSPRLRRSTLIQVIGDANKKTSRNFFVRLQKRWKNVSVRKTGVLPHKAALEALEKTDVVCLPSLDDGMPNTLLEAMALGKPIIASDFFSPLLQNNKEALIFQANNPKDLEKKIAQLMDDPSLRKKIGLNAQLKVKDYSAVREGQSYIQIYKRAISK